MGAIGYGTNTINTRKANVTKEYYAKMLLFTCKHTGQENALRLVETAFTEMWKQSFTNDASEPLFAYELYLRVFLCSELYGKKVSNK